MALPPGFTLEQPSEATSSGGLPAGFQLETAAPVASSAPPPAPALAQVPSNRLGGVVSLMDSTIGSIPSTVAQMFGSPLARLGRSPEAAQAVTQGIVSSIDKPFGKLFGVTDTPQYQNEASRKVMDFIGENTQKGAQWISSKTGIAAPDVESYLASLSIAAPMAGKAAGGALREAGGQLTAGLQLPFERQLQARREAASLKDYQRGPQIDAAAEAQRLNLVIDPVNIKPGAGTRMLSALAGDSGTAQFVKANKNTVREISLREMGLPLDRQLNGPAAFNESLSRLAGPQQSIRQMPTMIADAGITSALEALRPDAALITADGSAKILNSRIDKAISKTSGGINGTEILRDIRSLRDQSSKIYGNKTASVAELDRAKSGIGIANTLEKMIENNISDPSILAQYIDSRGKMAKTYALKSATDFNTGIVDMSKLSRMTTGDNALTGDIASLAQVAGNFPEAFSADVTPKGVMTQLKRTGLAGTGGAALGYALGGYGGGAMGAALGAGAGELAQAGASRFISSPGYQAGLSLLDSRLPAAQMAPIPGPTPPAPPPKDFIPTEVLMAGEGTYFPDFTNAAGGQRPQFTTSFGQRALPNEVPQQVYQAQTNAELAQRLRSNDASQSSIYGQRRGTPFQAPEGIPAGQALPEQASIKSAADKVAAGQQFNMSAAEKVAWNNTKIQLVEAIPQWRGLSDKAIAQKMLGRAP